MNINTVKQLLLKSLALTKQKQFLVQSEKCRSIPQLIEEFAVIYSCRPKEQLDGSYYWTYLNYKVFANIGNKQELLEKIRENAKIIVLESEYYDQKRYECLIYSNTQNLEELLKLFYYAFDGAILVLDSDLWDAFVLCH